MRLVLLSILLACVLVADDIDDLAARIESLAAKEASLPRAATLRRATQLLEQTRPGLAMHFRNLSAQTPAAVATRSFLLPALTEDSEALDQLVERIEHNGDDPAAYDRLAAFIRNNRLSAGLDNPSIRARIALSDLEDLVDPVLVGLDGAAVRLSLFRAQRVTLLFWATWCIPCRAELSMLEKADNTVLAISWESSETVRRFLHEHPYKLHFYIDPGHRLSDHLGVDRIPVTVALHPDGSP